MTIVSPTQAVLLLLFWAYLSVTAMAAPSAPPARPAPAPAPPKARSGISILKLTYDPPLMPLPLVTVRIGDSDPLLFLVDTGLNDSVLLTRWASERLHLDRSADRDPKPVTIDGKPYLHLHFAQKLPFKMLPVTGSVNLQINSADILCALDDSGMLDTISRNPRIAGVLGMSFWAANALQFDFARNTLTVFVNQAPDSSASASRIGNGVAPLTIRQWPGFEPIPQIQSSVTKATKTAHPPSEWLVIDTGSDSTNLPQSLRNGASVQAGGESQLLQHNQSVATEQSLLHSLVLDNALTEPDIEVNWIQGKATPNLGMNLLARFRVTIDLAHKRLYLERASNYEEARRVAGSYGLVFDQDDAGRYRVTDIPEKAPIAGYGVTVGDEILEIDGYPLKDLTLYQAQQLSSGYAGTVTYLMLHRTSGEVKVVWLIHPNPYTDAPSEEDKPVVRLRSANKAEVTYPDGKKVVLAYNGNLQDLPPADALPGYYWDRYVCPDGSHAWAMLPESAAAKGTGAPTP